MSNKDRPLPPDVVFSDRIALIPLIGSFFDRPLWVHNPNPIYFQDTPNFKIESWVNKGDPILSFLVTKYAHRSFWYNLPRELIGRSTTFATIYSPVSGMVLDRGDAFVGGIKEQEGSFMLAVLLPDNEIVPRTIADGFSEFCRFCSTHRESIFRSRRLVSESGIETVSEIWSEEKINKVLADLGSNKICVKPASSSSYRDLVADFKQRNPGTFRPGVS